MFDRILVPLDGSKLAESIFPSLLPLAQKLGSNLVLLLVNEGGNEDRAEAHPAGAVSRLAQGPMPTLERSVTASGIRGYLAGVAGYLASTSTSTTSSGPCTLGSMTA